MSIKKRMTKRKVVSSYKDMVFDSKNEQAIDTHNIDESQHNHVE